MKKIIILILMLIMIRKLPLQQTCDCNFNRINIVCRKTKIENQKQKPKLTVDKSILSDCRLIDFSKPNQYVNLIAENFRIWKFNGLDMFEKLMSMEFQFNEIDFMPNFNQFISLKNLTISFNQLAYLTESDYFPNSIGRLDFKNNRLVYIKRDCFSNLEQLEYLNLEYNHLRLIDLSIKMKNFEIFLISNNDLDNYVRLELLNANNEKSIKTNRLRIAILNTIITKMPHLSRFDLDYEINYLNKHSKIEINVTKILNYTQVKFNSEDSQQISHLDYQTFFTDLHDYLIFKMIELDLFSIPNLNSILAMRVLDLTNNKIISLNSPNNLPIDLEIIHLENNRIEFIDDGFFSRFKRLRELYLGYNFLTNISVLEFNSNYLQRIDLKNSNVNELKKLVFKNNEHITNLELNLDGNNLGRIPSFQGNVESISSLSIKSQNSMIGFLNMSFFDVFKQITPKIDTQLVVRSLSLSQNLITSFDSEFYCMLNSKVNSYLRFESVYLIDVALETKFYCYIVLKNSETFTSSSIGMWNQNILKQFSNREGGGVRETDLESGIRLITKLRFCNITSLQLARNCSRLIVQTECNYDLSYGTYFKNYFAIDRTKLIFLNLFEKIKSSSAHFGYIIFYLIFLIMIILFIVVSSLIAIEIKKIQLKN